VTAVMDSVQVNKAMGGLLAISMDEMTRQQRTFYYASSKNEDRADSMMVDGQQRVVLPTHWLNIDQSLGIVGSRGATMAFGDLSNNNSVMTARLYADYHAERKMYMKGGTVGRRSLTYYSNVSAEQTAHLADMHAEPTAPDGWRATIAGETDGTLYLFVSNFTGNEHGEVSATLQGRALHLSLDLPQQQSRAYQLKVKKHKVRVSPMKK